MDAPSLRNFVHIYETDGSTFSIRGARHTARHTRDFCQKMLHAQNWVQNLSQNDMC